MHGRKRSGGHVYDKKGGVRVGPGEPQRRPPSSTTRCGSSGSSPHTPLVDEYRRVPDKIDDDDHPCMWVRWRRWVAQLIRQTIQQQKYVAFPRSTILLLSRHPYLPLSLVEEYCSSVPWDFLSMESHPDMTPQFHARYFHGSWRSRTRQTPSQVQRTIAHFQGRHGYQFSEWERKPHRKTFLTYHPHFPLALALHHPTFGWDFTFLLLYREWTIPQIHRMLAIRRMDWKLFSRNPFLTISMVHEFLRYPWDWPTLATHPCFPPHVVFDDPILLGRWKWRSVFKNPRITVDFWKRLITEYPKVVHDPLIILHNRFEYDTVLRHWAIFQIHRFVQQCRQRRRLREKIRLMRHIHDRLPSDLVHTILTFA